MNNFSFSVAMSVYYKDNAVFFDRALQSITERQTVKPTEIVLVCDGSLNEQLDAVIDKYRKQYPIFKILRLKDNGGLGNALKLAVENASNEIIARMDSDDISVSDRFEQQLKFFSNHPEVDIVGGNITEFIGDEKKRCAFNHMSVMYKKSAIRAAGGYLDWFWNEDYYLWIRMQLYGFIFANTGTVLVNVRVGEEMYQRRGGSAYFKSEKKLQDYMLKHKMINKITYVNNVGKRFVVQMLLSNRVRGWVFRKFARSD